MQQSWNTVLDNVAEANQKAVAAAAELNKIATRTQGLLVGKQIAALETCLDAGAKHLKVATETRDPNEAIKLHAEVAVELGEKLVAATQESLEIQAQARDDLARWVEDGLKAVQSEVEAASKPAAPARKTTRSVKKAA